MLSFSGCSRHQLDDKGRFNLPKRFVDQIGDRETTFRLTAGPDGCLMLLDSATWLAEAEPLMQQVFGTRKQRLRRRVILGHAEEVVPDKAGRVLLPEPLRKYADIDLSSNVWLVGAGKAIEIWSNDRWSRFVKQMEAATFFDEESNLADSESVATAVP